MYNVLEKLRSGEPLSPKDKVIHAQGLVSVLESLHDPGKSTVGWLDTPEPARNGGHGESSTCRRGTALASVHAERRQTVHISETP